MTFARRPPAHPPARRVRQALSAGLQDGIEPLSRKIANRLLDLAARPPGRREAQARQDVALQFRDLRTEWVAAVVGALQQGSASAAAAPAGDDLDLVGDEVVEARILVARLAQAIEDEADWSLPDLLARLRHLEGAAPGPDDLAHPQGLARCLVLPWIEVGLRRDAWPWVADVVASHVAPLAAGLYEHLNDELARQGVLPDIDAARPVRRHAEGPTPVGTDPATPAAAGAGGGRAGGAPGAFAGGGGGGGGGGSSGGAGGTGVLGRMRRLLSSVPGLRLDRPAAVSPALAALLAEPVPTGGFPPGVPGEAGDGAVAQAARELRDRANLLKRSAGTPTERALVEIVALLFQAILSEERIAPTVRVWIARLQMPVLRVALAEPAFFDSVDHPARRLIDRIGACALGLDPAADRAGLEGEIRRIVQTIEQYPETGRRVFELAGAEFEQFLGRQLAGRGPAARLASVAQQVEQRETMTIRYTIELRKMLDAVPVRDEVRTYLFKVWAEVMAVAAVRHGSRHEQTLALRQCAADLVWAAGAKPDRAERERVVRELPGLLRRLRQGMALLGWPAERQEAELKRLNEALTDAFRARTAAIPADRIQAIAQQLAGLEALAGDDPVDLPLDAEGLRVLLGSDAQQLEIIVDGGRRPDEAARQRARALEPGTWFVLDHNARTRPVQYAWRSERGQLHLFIEPQGGCVLVQAGRLAAYLQAGLLVPQEAEPLTVRASRDALARLDANPERLLS